MIEAELKTRVRDPAALAGRLRRMASGETSLYRDTHHDRPAGAFTDVRAVLARSRHPR